jgi:hypothetical protein
MEAIVCVMFEDGHIHTHSTDNIRAITRMADYIQRTHVPGLMKRNTTVFTKKDVPPPDQMESKRKKPVSYLEVDRYLDLGDSTDSVSIGGK